MNEAMYVLAQLKRWLVNTREYFGSGDVLRKIAQFEAEAVLGEDFEPEEEEAGTDPEEES